MTEPVAAKTSDKDEELLTLAKARMERGRDAWSDVFSLADDDLLFLSDEDGAQWWADEYNKRKNTGRPTITCDVVSQFVHAATNEIKMNTPTIQVIAGDNGDTDTAEVIGKRIKDIEYKSKADVAYDTAATFSVKSSLGFIRVDHDYADQKSFNQDIRILRCINPKAYILDPDSIEIDGSDAMWGIVLDKMTVKAFKEKYPGVEVSDFAEDVAPSGGYNDADVVTVAEYFYIEEAKKTMRPKADNSGDLEEIETTEANEENEPSELNNGETVGDQPLSPDAATSGDEAEEERTREITKRTVWRCKLSGNAVLTKPSRFPGKYVPIVPVYGEECWRDGKRELKSLVRMAKEPAKMRNLWKSLETESLMKQTIAPVAAPVGATEDFAADYKDPTKAAVLRYNGYDAKGRPIGPPSRIQPPQTPSGFANGAITSVDDVKSGLGMYNAAVGEQGNETSGIAIQRRDQQSDVGNYHFNDNLVKSISHVGVIITCMLEETHDTRRVISLMDEEGNSSTVGINGERVDKQDRDYDFSNASDYGVRVITGPSFTTQRQQAADFYSKVASQWPEFMQIAGDLVFSYSDAPGAKQIAERLKKTPGIAQLLDPDEKDPKAPDPKVQQLTQHLEQMAQQLQQSQAQLQDKQGMEQLKANELQQKAAESASTAQLNQAKLQLQQAQLQFSERELEQNTTVRLAELEVEKIKAQTALLQLQSVQNGAPYTASQPVVPVP